MKGLSLLNIRSPKSRLSHEPRLTRPS